MVKYKWIVFAALAALALGMALDASAQDTTSMQYWTPREKPGPPDYNGYGYLIFAVGASASCYFVFKGIRRI